MGMQRAKHQLGSGKDGHVLSMVKAVCLPPSAKRIMPHRGSQVPLALVVEVVGHQQAAHRQLGREVHEAQRACMGHHRKWVVLVRSWMSLDCTSATHPGMQPVHAAGKQHRRRQPGCQGSTRAGLLSTPGGAPW